MRRPVQAVGGEGQVAGVWREHVGLQPEDGGGGRRPYWPQNRHRGPATRRASYRDREEDILHQEQRPPSVALDH